MGLNRAEHRPVQETSMKKTLLAMVLAASMAPFTFAAQDPATPAQPDTTKPAKKAKKHSKKAKKSETETPAPAAPKQ
jgi:hypothetical protein